MSGSCIINVLRSANQSADILADADWSVFLTADWLTSI